MAIPNQLAEFHLTFFSCIIVIQTNSGASLLFFFSSFVLCINFLLKCRQSYLCIIEQDWMELVHA